MLIYILLGFNFLFTIGLFTIILKPEWSKFLKRPIASSINTSEDNRDKLNTEVEVKTDTIESEKLAKIKGQLEIIKMTFRDVVHKNGEIKLYSIINNIQDYLQRMQPNDYFLLENIEDNLKRIDKLRPEGDPLPKMNEMAIQLLPTQELLYQYFSSTRIYSQSIQPFYESALKELSKELNNFRKLKDILANASTIEIYQIEKKQHSNSHIIYLTLFFIFIIFGLVFAYFSIELKEQIIGENNKNFIDYWVLKASGIFVSITLITFFLKQAIHHQKRKEQVERTMLELKALPAYMADLSSEDAKNLRNTLASKYFGNSNDNSTINEISGLLTEQLKNSTEVAKSSAEVIKALQPKS